MNTEGTKESEEISKWENSEGRILRELESDKDEGRENVYSNFQEDTKGQLFLLQKLPVTNNSNRKMPLVAHFLSITRTPKAQEGLL